MNSILTNIIDTAILCYIANSLIYVLKCESYLILVETSDRNFMHK